MAKSIGLMKALRSGALLLSSMGRLQNKSRFPGQVCQMVYFRTKNPNLGKFLRSSEGKSYDNLEYFTDIWYNFMAIWYNNMAICYNLLSFGIFFPFWYVWSKENLATPFSRSVLDQCDQNFVFG
jgi:hypothetical protein